MIKKLNLFLLISLSILFLTACTTTKTQSHVPTEITPASTPTPKETLVSTPSPEETSAVDKTKAEIFTKLDGLVTSGIIFDLKGNMLVGKNGEIVKISPNGEVTTFASFSTLPKGKNYYFASPLPWDMVIDKDGSILAAAQDRILKISETGEITTIIREDFNGFLGASGLELDRDGNMYITNGSLIMKYSPDMKASVFIDGSDMGFNTFFSLKFDPDFNILYATDFETSTLVKYPIDSEGNADKAEIVISKPIKNAYPYGAPLNMVFSETGTLYCSLDCRWQLLKLSPEGNIELIQMPSAGDNHYIAFGAKGFNEDCIYFTTFNGKGIYSFYIGEKGN